MHNDLLYFHLQLKNSSNVPFNVDYLTFKITDKKVAKRTAIQEQVVWPVRAYNNVQVIGGKRTERMVFTLPKFTLADASSWSWNCTSSKAGDTRLSRWRMPTWCAHVLSTS